jgi:hypothetical protein
MNETEKEKAFREKAKTEADKFAIGFMRSVNVTSTEVIIDTYDHILELLKCFADRQIVKFSATLGYAGVWTVVIEGKRGLTFAKPSSPDDGREHDATDDLPRHIEDARELELGSKQAGEPDD